MADTDNKGGTLVPTDPIDQEQENGAAPDVDGDEEGAEQRLPAKREPGRVQRWLKSCLPRPATPLNKPQVAEDFQDLGALERVVESLRYNTLSLEYAVSPKGGLRQWLKLNLALLLLVGLPVLILAPVIVYLLKELEAAGGHVEEFTGHLFSSLENIFYSVLTIVALVALVATVVYLARMAWLRMRGVDVGEAEVIEINPVQDQAGKSGPAPESPSQSPEPAEVLEVDDQGNIIPPEGRS
ncbi:MAG: hypothetical protein D6E12_08490 [Desulfovibrio sp.]|nr:MAG: hypothetical protein D6E12_08490 [Desulfovibrio sp.]